MKCTLKRTGEVLAKEVEIANTYFTRLKGLMFRRGLEPGKGLLLDPCPQIHTCFMRFNIDAVFFNKDGLVLYVAEQMKPWRFGRFVRGSRYTLELPGGTLAGRVKKGDEVLLS
ncbi:DUF192 domain-containing protein [Candidatus Avelusimicrobium gallicola]|uniref:DUF192 domain-containing protein n=1 Tax=Candidatus Avelusimicrobium gallicola TaxID=2562704 RepID=A0A1Y4DBK2_9BACT|nr:DUF192 domain-containing protein [Elusimicrobium sp. An273]OUO56544.1 hypothetical protein B5F75_04950 [Elusimicrobium sp. An273]